MANNIQKDKARTIAKIIEEHMTELGWSEEKKNEAVAKAGKVVDEAVKRHKAKRKK